MASCPISSDNPRADHGRAASKLDALVNWIALCVSLQDRIHWWKHVMHFANLFMAIYFTCVTAKYWNPRYIIINGRYFYPALWKKN